MNSNTKLMAILLMVGALAFTVVSVSEESDDLVADDTDTVVKIGETGYTSLGAAIEAVTEGQTIVLQQDIKDAEGLGIFKSGSKLQVKYGGQTKDMALAVGGDFIIDFNGFTYEISKGAKGSSGTATQPIHIEKGCKITFYNGTISVPNGDGTIVRGANFYDDVILDDIIWNSTSTIQSEVMKFISGNSIIRGNTSIYAAVGDAVELGWWPDGYKGYDSTLLIETTGQIVGDVGITVYYYTEPAIKPPTTENVELKITDVSLIGKVHAVEDVDAAMALAETFPKLTGGQYTSDPSKYVIEGYEAKLISDVYYVGETGSDDDTIITEETETAEDGTEVTTEAIISVDSTGKVSGATVNIETSTGSKATARINSSGSTTLVSDTKEDIQLSDKALETIIDLSKSASGSDSVSLNVTTSGTSVSLGAYATEAVSDGFLYLSLTMNRGTSAQATITLNSGSLEAGSTYMLSVAGNASKASALTNAGLDGTTPFDIKLTSDDVIVNLDGSVTISVPVDSEYDSMRMYCIDTGESYAVSYSNGTVTATIPHFSTWSVIYEKRTIVTDYEDDIFFILEQQKKAQEAASSQTTSEDNSGEEAAVIIAAAAVAGAMLACAFFAFRRN